MRDIKMMNLRRGKCVKQKFLKVFCRPSHVSQDSDSNLSALPILPGICSSPPLPDFASSQYSFHEFETSSPQLRSPSSVVGHPLPLSSNPTCSKPPSYHCSLSTDEDVDNKEKLDDVVRDVLDGRGLNANVSSILDDKRDQSPPKILAPIIENEVVTKFSNKNDTREFISYVEEKSPPANQAAFGNEIQLMNDLKQQTKLLLESFCILNTQFPGHPISAASADILPGEDTLEEEYTYLEEDLGDQPWQVRRLEIESEESYQLLLKIDLFQHRVEKATHQLITLCDITEFLRRPSLFDHSVASQDHCRIKEDAWLFIALEAMGKSNTQIEPKRLEDNVPDSFVESSPCHPSDDQLHTAIASIRPMYEHCFTIASSSSYQDYRITHVSHDLMDQFSPPHSSLRHMLPKSADEIMKRLMRGRRFFTEVKEEGQEARRLICCNPMFGPNLKCWLCFFILGSPSCSHSK